MQNIKRCPTAHSEELPKEFSRRCYHINVSEDNIFEIFSPSYILHTICPTLKMLNNQALTDSVIAKAKALTKQTDDFYQQVIDYLSQE